MAPYFLLIKISNGKIDISLSQLHSIIQAHKSSRNSGRDIKLAETILPTPMSAPLKVMLKNVGKMTPEGITTKDDRTTTSKGYID